MRNFEFFVLTLMSLFVYSCKSWSSYYNKPISWKIHRPVKFMRVTSIVKVKQREDIDEECEVILQKVMQSVPLFLLMEYIRDAFEIPTDLPLPYERCSNIEMFQSLLDEEGGSIIAGFKCVMDEFQAGTIPESSLVVQVLGIRVEGEESLVPRLAMVTVKKLRNNFSSDFGGLYEASEKKLIEELDYGLDELVKKRGYGNVESFQEKKDEKSKVEEKTLDAEIIKNNNDNDNNNAADQIAKREIEKKLDRKYEDERIYQDVNAELIQEKGEEKSVVDEEPFTTEIINSSNDATEEKKKVEEKKEIYGEFEERMNVETRINNINSDLMEEGIDMTPQEIFDSVVKFGEDLEAKEKEGVSFATTALEKAKELLKQKEKISDFMQVDNEQDELRSLFMQGEKLAKGRLKSSSDEKKKEDEEYIDKIIESDTTIRRTAKRLEDDLAELEIRVNRPATDEETISQEVPVFDIFSGPTEKNDSVDPANTVSWPGYVPSDAKVNSPTLNPDLNEALKNAQFASRTLLSLQQDTKDGVSKYYIDEKEISQNQVDKLIKYTAEAVIVGLIDDPFEAIAEKSRLQLLLDELSRLPIDDVDDTFEDVVSQYKDLLLSDQFVSYVRERLKSLPTPEQYEHFIERQHLSKLVNYASFLLKETQAFGAELETMQLEIIRSICKVAMDPKHKTEQEAAIALSDAVQDMKPLLDDHFVAYLKFAIKEEEGRLARRGLLDDFDHCSWLMVLKIVQSGVYAELAKGINRYLEHIWYIIRMETRKERKMLLEKIVDDLPTMDVRPFHKVVTNIVSSLGTGAKGNFDGIDELATLTKPLLQLATDLNDILPPEKLALKSRDADEWIRSKKQKFLEQQKQSRNKLKQKLQTETQNAGGQKFSITDIERF